MKVKKKLTLIAFFTAIIIILLTIGVFYFSSYKDRLISFKYFTSSNYDDYYSPSQKKIDILSYKINISLNFSKRSIKGNVEILGRILDRNIKNIVLNFYNSFKIRKFKLNGKETIFDYSNNKLKIPYNNSLLDTFSINIQYTGKPENLGLGSFTFDKFKGSPIVYTLNEPVFASTWFPCNDLPSDKALASVSITNDSSMVSVSNGVLDSLKTKGNRRTYFWRSSYPISTYLIVFYSAKYKKFYEKFRISKKNIIKLQYFVFPQHVNKAKIDFAVNKKALKIFSNLFGTYPFIKEKYGIAEFTWTPGAMENQTITGLGDKFINGHQFFTDMLVHELAHQWWGDAVGPATWKDIWLNEGFATYSEALYWEKLAGASALRSTMVSFRGLFKDGTLYNPGKNIFSKLVYNKGAWVLQMLRRDVGDSLFFKILKSYYKKYRYKNASSFDFKNLCERISGKDLSHFFNQWVFKGKGIPYINYSYKTDLLNGKDFNNIIKISQVQKLYRNFRFPLDIKFTGKNAADFLIKTIYITSNDTIIKIRTTFYPKTINLDPDNWLLAKIKNKNTIEK